MDKQLKIKEVFIDEGRLPPQNIDVEEQVLGMLMQLRNAYTDAAAIIDADCFYKEANRLIYIAISELETSGNKADGISVINKLRNKKKLEEVGGAYYLMQIIGKTVSYDLLEQHCKVLKEKQLYRKLIEIGHKLVSSGYSEEEDVFTLFSEAGETIASSISLPVNSLHKTNEALKEVTEQIDRNCGIGTQITGIATGFYEFDKRSRGLQKSDLVVIAAETSMGKSSLVTSIVRNAALKGAKIGFYSLEMTKEQLAARLLAIETAIPVNEILYSKLSEEKIKTIQQNISRLCETDIYFDERSTNHIDGILTSIRYLKTNFNIDIAVVDYLQLIGNNKRNINREQQVAEIARAFKNIAKELNINVILLSQLSRCNGDPFPKLSRLRDSGQIEEAADIVMFIYRPEIYGRTYPVGFEHYPVQNTAMIDIAKGRNIGLLRFIVNFNPQTTHFFPFDEDRDLLPECKKPDW